MRSVERQATSERTQLFWRYEQSGDPAEIEAKMADNITQGRAALAQWLG